MPRGHAGDPQLRGERRSGARVGADGAAHLRRLPARVREDDRDVHGRGRGVFTGASAAATCTTDADCATVRLCRRSTVTEPAVSECHRCDPTVQTTHLGWEPPPGAPRVLRRRRHAVLGRCWRPLINGGVPARSAFASESFIQRRSEPPGDLRGRTAGRCRPARSGRDRSAPRHPRRGGPGGHDRDPVPRGGGLHRSPGRRRRLEPVRRPPRGERLGGGRVHLRRVHRRISMATTSTTPTRASSPGRACAGISWRGRTPGCAPCEVPQVFRGRVIVSGDQSSLSERAGLLRGAAGDPAAAHRVRALSGARGRRRRRHGPPPVAARGAAPRRARRRGSSRPGRRSPGR
jgi:hypothetical protein